MNTFYNKRRKILLERLIVLQKILLKRTKERDKYKFFYDKFVKVLNLQNYVHPFHVSINGKDIYYLVYPIYITHIVSEGKYKNIYLFLNDNWKIAEKNYPKKGEFYLRIDFDELNVIMSKWPNYDRFIRIDKSTIINIDYLNYFDSDNSILILTHVSKDSKKQQMNIEIKIRDKKLKKYLKRCHFHNSSELISFFEKNYKM